MSVQQLWAEVEEASERMLPHLPEGDKRRHQNLPSLKMESLKFYRDVLCADFSKNKASNIEGYALYGKNALYIGSGIKLKVVMRHNTGVPVSLLLAS